MSLKRFLAISMAIVAHVAAKSDETTWPEGTPGEFEIEDFEFQTGQTLDTIRMAYTTFGTPKEDENGQTTNAVLIMHGTGGSSANFWADHFAGQLFNPGQPLDVEKYYVIVRDALGHGNSSKPSDGLRAKFPSYGYIDMVNADYRMLTEGLGVNHARLVMGTSMGGMHSWLWPEMYPDFMDASMPLASLPVQLAGRNRMSRKMMIDTITEDPAWLGGNYTQQPVHGLKSAQYVLTWMTSVPLQWQKDYPTRDEADDFLDLRIGNAIATTDTNDLLYAVNASSDYDPYPKLEQIKVPLLAWNSADDQVNPPELRILEDNIGKVPKGRAVLHPITDETRGHGSHTYAHLWKEDLIELLEESGGQL